ncbi:MAG: ribulose-phosphate 3-epimerase [Lachnospiraceae bacterium]|mgnify:FL=1|jgi:ribulose-phosphate 3-epimerase|nr:ribulose-phosphate 3-epimerase [Lachnospiraceae bacterium]
MNYLAPSILSADFLKLGEQLELVEKNGVSILHIDVMDGMFVPSISLGFPVIESIRRSSKMIFDVHLMIKEPERYLERFAAGGADIITVHAEACLHLHRTIQQIRRLGKKCGVALNPATPLSALDYVLEDLDMVLLMTVNPGFGGQSFIPAMYEKIHGLRELIAKKNLKIDIEVDGGIKAANTKQVIEAGANILVAGSAVFEGDIEGNIREFQKIM